MKTPNVNIEARTSGGLILRGHNGRHRKSGWWWHRPLTDGQVIRLYDYFRNKPQR